VKKANDVGPAQKVKRLGRDLGFDLVRITEATQLHAERIRYLNWIEQGRQGAMHWITPEHATRSSDPSAVLPRARSVVCVGLAYWAGARPKEGANRGKIARYAWGRDYHTVIEDKLRRMAEILSTDLGGEHRWYVDTGPLMDKALAARSGLGWYGRNTNILTEPFGSFVLLGEIVTTLCLEPDSSLHRDCGACKLCVVGCPTGALGGDYTIDSRKCISYLTIEHRGAIPRELRPAIAGWVFGCDICQDICPPTMRPYLKTPAQRRAWAGETRRYVAHGAVSQSDADLEPVAQRMSERESSNPLFSTGTRASVDLLWLLELTHDEYLAAFSGTAIRRAKVWMLRRNAAVALGNVGDQGAVEPLIRAMQTDEHAVVRGHAAWALGRLGRRLCIRDVVERLRAALEAEQDAEVRQEIEEALRDFREPAIPPAH
jgi:epoxyqueuosine reductase